MSAEPPAMASSNPALPDDALYLGDDILKESVDALQRSLNIMDQKLGYTDDSTYNGEGYPMDWRGLAMIMKYSRMEIQRWEAVPNKTTTVVIAWSKTSKDSSIRALLDYFRQLRHFGLLRDMRLISAIVDDVETYRIRLREREEEARRQEERRREDEARIRRLHEEARNPALKPDMRRDRPHWFSSQAKNHLVIPKVGQNPQEIRYFDAFVCYAYEDIQFVKKMLKAMEENKEGEEGSSRNPDEYGNKTLDLCVDDRDFYVGSYKYTFTARVMEERCKRIVLIMSPHFVNTPMCAFQTEYALSLSPGAANKKLLPIMYKQCEVPAGLKHIAGLYYTRDELREWFWPRLRGSLHADLQWDEDQDHEKPDWDQITLPTEQVLPATRNEILQSGRKKKSKGLSSSKATSGSSSSIDSHGKHHKKSGSLSNLSGSGASPLVGKKSTPQTSASASGSGDPLGAFASKEGERLDPTPETACRLLSDISVTVPEHEAELTEMPSFSATADEPTVTSSSTTLRTKKKLKLPSFLYKNKPVAEAAK